MSIENRITPWERLSGLRECISRKGFARILEAHSGLSGLEQPPARPRISDRINVEQMLDEFHARNSQHEKKTKAN